MVSPPACAFSQIAEGTGAGRNLFVFMTSFSYLKTLNPGGLLCQCKANGYGKYPNGYTANGIQAESCIIAALQEVQALL